MGSMFSGGAPISPSSPSSSPFAASATGNHAKQPVVGSVGKVNKNIAGSASKDDSGRGAPKKGSGASKAYKFHLTEHHKAIISQAVLKNNATASKKKAIEIKGKQRS